MGKVVFGRILLIGVILTSLHFTASATDLTTSNTDTEKVNTEQMTVFKSDSTSSDQEDDENSLINRFTSTDDLDKGNDTPQALEDDPTSQESGSIVSFNLIYYIIEKFKFSDLLGL